MSGNLKGNVPQSRKMLGKDKKILLQLGYDIGKKIGEGAFATVRHVNKLSNKGATTPIAVKIIDKARSPLFTERFVTREISIWPKLRHKNIIKIQNMYEIETRIYVFMELAAKGSVIEYVLTHGAVDEILAQKWCKGICHALMYCHSKGIAHRDLKCDNLLLNSNLQIKICDFGFCCSSVNQQGVPILSDTYVGSSSYLAPEIIQNRPYDPLPADVWSAGVCIFVMLNNSMPFNDSNIARMHKKQLKKQFKFAPEIDNKLSASAKDVVVRMLNPKVEERPTFEQILDSQWLLQNV